MGGGQAGPRSGESEAQAVGDAQAAQGGAVAEALKRRRMACALRFAAILVSPLPPHPLLSSLSLSPSRPRSRSLSVSLSPLTLHPAPTPPHTHPPSIHRKLAPTI